MRTDLRGILLPLAALALASTAGAQLSHGAIDDFAEPMGIGVSWRHKGPDTRVRVDVTRCTGSIFHVFACPVRDGFIDADARVYVGSGPIDADGAGAFEFQQSGMADLPAGSEVAFTVLTAGGRRLPGTSTIVVGVAPPCEEIDFDAHPDPNFDLPLPGTPIEEQWTIFGMEISGDNNVAGHPDLVIGYDSANPTDEDPDLETPGDGPGNDVALGTLLIIAENDTDMNNDGVIDVPDDEEGGGTLHFDFDPPARLCSITLVDIDDANGTRLDFFGGNGPLSTIGVPNMGDNSVQTLLFDVRGVERLDVVLGGSGGVGSIGASLCPTIVDFDEATTGVDLGLEAGMFVEDQLQSLGIAISATNNAAGHPDVATLFDTGLRTGEDDDLAIPGYGPGNDDPDAPGRGLVLVIAEDVEDGNNDGKIDDPDDEALGGTIVMDFTEPITFESATVLDVDTFESARFELFDTNNQLTVVPLQSLGDNSLQTVEPSGGVAGVVRIELHLSGSGAWVDLQYCPEDGDPAP